MQETDRALRTLMNRQCGAGELRNLKRLSSGASMETWSLDWHTEQHHYPLILRRSPLNEGIAEAQLQRAFGKNPIKLEAALLKSLQDHDLKIPTVVAILQMGDGLGEGYLMSRESGEALPQRILTDAEFEPARKTLAQQCGQQLAKLHRVPVKTLPKGLNDLTLAQRLHHLQALSDEFGSVSPVHQLALNWLGEHQPEQHRRSLVHGDFRNGNLLIQPAGLSAILDWELSHIGSPEEDLGYLCANVWRFGQPLKPVGGFGEYDQLLDAYAAEAGWRPQLDVIKYWELHTALMWGLICMSMERVYLDGHDRSLERLAIGQRMSESEVDILLLLDELQTLGAA